MPASASPSPKKSGNGVIFFMFFLANLFCFAAALVCLIAALGGWLQYGDWHWPGWTIAGTFGFSDQFEQTAGASRRAADIIKSGSRLPMELQP